MKIRKGDTIRVITGKDKGREGEVERVYKKQNKILVAGINMYKKHMRKSEEFPQGGIVEVPRPLDASKVMKVASDGKSITRIGYVLENGKKFRIEKKTKERVTTKK